MLNNLTIPLCIQNTVRYRQMVNAAKVKKVDRKS